MNKLRPYFYYFLFFLVTLLSQNSSWAQVITKSYHFPKMKIVELEFNGVKTKMLTFDGSVTANEFPDLPAFRDKVEVNHLYASYQYTISNAKYEALTSDEAFLASTAEDIFTEPDIKIKTATHERKHYAILSIIPIIKSASGQYQRLVSCDIRFEGVAPISVTRMVRPANSVLAAGTWYKIAVSANGLYKVTYKDLKDLGVPMSGLRSSNIVLFGNGGGMIPDINPALQTDDLLECPIMIHDNNGNFDETSYFIFYAQGPHTWEYNPNTEIFFHKYNIYSNYAYYFINVNSSGAEKKRIEKKNFLNETANKEAGYFMHYDFYEKDLFNFEESGRDWYDDAFSSSKTYSFTLPEVIENSGRIKIRVASTATVAGNMELLWGTNSRVFSISATSPSFPARNTVYSQNNLPFTSGNLSFVLKYNSSQSSAVVRLDYIEIQTKCKLQITGAAMPFAITENIGSSNISAVNLRNASAQTMIWDVTDHNAVYALEGKLTGTQLLFHTPTDKPRLFIAFNGTAFNSVTPVGKVENQDLHGFRSVDMVIVSPSVFLSEANRLAQFRAKANNISVKVVTPEQIYNEFSSGAQDPAAIRNFMRYLYDNDAQTIKYLLLFGRPSYDFRGIMKGTQIFVPNFQGKSSETGYLLTGASCDNFFGILGVNEGDMSGNFVNIAVGRFPVTTLSQAKIAVDKTINASLKQKVVLQNASQISNFGDWRNIMAFVTDDYDGTNYTVAHGEYFSNTIASNYPSFNLDKIYSDAYPQISFAGGQRYPDVNKAINMRMNRGALMIGYFGHGGGNGWSHERILEIVDINSWKNKFNQPLMITLTCSFGWYDKQAISPAELVFLNDNGGASSLITTSREISIPSHYATQFFREIGSKFNNRYKTLGEINRFAINNANVPEDAVNKIYLIGDPAMIINIPTHNVKTDSIFGEDRHKIDTLKALSKVTVKGRITDDSGNTLTDFNGNVFPSIFDKAVKQKTLGQKGSPINEFFVQKNIVFKGNATVKNGLFEFSFIVPKDINFEYGKGKISYYAASENDDAGDYFDNFMIGGMSDKPIIDNKGPEISIFLNDDKFVPGGITNPDPTLILKLKDEYGINTSGNGIGHDIVAILDNEVEKQMVMNDYYLADQDSYNSGTVRYALQNLTPGPHVIKVRAWDILNNPSEASIDFVVKSDEKLILAHVLNYPNPFTTKTSFYFEHNQPIETFDILIHIFTVSGKLVKTLRDNQFLEGNRSYPIDWDGRDEYGDKIGKGVYLYRLTVRNSQGETAEKIEKIAIL